jgi:glycosyltransferase involved in cell wall biosynthesis
VLTVHALPWFVSAYTPALPGLHQGIEAGLWIYGHWLLQQCEAVITPSRVIADIVSAHAGCRPQAIGNGVDLRRFTSRPAFPGEGEALRQKYGLDLYLPIILYVGRLDVDKRVDLIVRAAAQAMRLPDQVRSEAVQRTITLLEERAAQKPDKAAWASALWHAAIDQARPTSTASIRFHGFLDEVCQALASFQVLEWPETIRVVGLQHNDWMNRLEDLEAGAWAVTLAEGPLGDQWRVWAVVKGARLGVIPQDAAIVGRTPATFSATFTLPPTATYADMHVVTA